MIEPEHLQTIQTILSQFPELHAAKVFIFGSRANSRPHHKFTDVDIGIDLKQPLPYELKSQIEETFDESNLPYIVDIVDFNTADDSFIKIASMHTIPLQLTHGKN